MGNSKSRYKYVEIYDKDDNSLIRIVLARSFKEAISSFIDDEFKNDVYCKNFKKL